LERLSDIELYYTDPSRVTNILLYLEGEEARHILQVMRHNINDEIFVTNGKGELLRCRITRKLKGIVEAYIIKRMQIENKFENITFCIPKLRQPERFEFAIEKCIEHGISNLIIFNANRSIVKGERLERWKKILLSAMKQSLKTTLPKISLINSLQDISNLEGEKVVLNQKSEKSMNELEIDFSKKYFFIFGPEGGLDENELNLFDKSDHFFITKSRLRSETAIVSVSSLLAIKNLS
jgi:16S rRNA (uracil1498-N3)-methyltransferase